MRILHVVTTLDRGGAETQLLELVAQQIRIQNQVSVIYLKGGGVLGEDLRRFGATVNTNLANLPLFKQIFFLGQAIKSGEFDLVHCHLPRAELMTALVVPRSTKFVVSRHNAEQFWPQAPNVISRLFSRVITKKTSAIICISMAVRNYLISNKEIHADSLDKAIVVYYGYKSKSKTKVFEPRNSWNSPPNKMVTISRLVEQKDLSTMIKGLKIYSESNKNASLTIVGKGSLKKELNELSRNLGLRVVFVEEILDATSFLTDFDVLLLTSSYEGFGLVLLEAMQARLPIVASNSKAALEVLGENHPGLFEIGKPDQLAHILTKMQELDVMKSNVYAGDTRLKLFDPSNMAHNVQSIYLQSL